MNAFVIKEMGKLFNLFFNDPNEQRGLELPPIRPLAEGEPLVLSFAQQRLWFLAHLEGQSATYNMPAALHLTGQLNKTALQRALTALIQRHDCLRLCFPVVDGEATVQLGEVYNPLNIIDLTDLSETEQQRQVTECIANHVQTPFDLCTGPLLSLRLLKLGQQEQILLFNMHHIISDAWSMAVLFRDLSQLYNAYAQNQVPQLPQLPIQYTDYAAWQRNWLPGEVLEQQLAYWREKLTGAPELLELPTDYPRPAVMRYQGKHLQSTLDIDITRGIKQLSQQHSVTVFMTLLAAFKVLLFRYSGQTDLVVGSPIANRTHHQTEDLIGFFVNTLVLRTQVKGEQTFPELLKQVRQTALEAYSHQDIPFEYLVEQVNLSRSLSHSPLFQVMFVLQNAPHRALELSGLKMSFLEPENTTAKFDLTLSVAEHGDVLVCDWEYNTDLFRSDTITRMTEHFQVLLAGILNKSELSLSKLPLLTEAEQQQLLAWNQTETDYPKDQTIVDLFQAQVDKTPDNIALVFEDQQLSYQQLNAKANQLAHYLMTLGVGAETLVGICVERSLEMVIGLLGILKAGGAYVPLDPDYPPERLQFMLEDSEVKVLLSQSYLLERLPVSTAFVICLESEWEKLAGYSGENPVRQSGPENLAYVIYTSGSTGVPKGVMVTHKGFFNLSLFQKKLFNVTTESHIMQFASLSFDATCWELAMTIPHGAEFHLSTADKLLPSNTLITLLKERRISHITLAPSALTVLPPETFLPHLQFLVVAGEACSSELVTKWSSGRKFINAYGPTESTVCATLTECQADGNSPPIGKPIANTQIYILDANHNPTPLGLPGELCIGGAGLARGYLNRPELTAEKFLELEIFGKPQRLYQTGDLARWLPDGNLEYLGRLDHQVKLRGFRIELGEIEAALSQHQAVKEAVVVLSNIDPNPRLVAYVTLAVDVVAGVLRTWLKTRLPEYMLPASFTVLDKLPLTPNGKIDRKALPAPDLTVFTETYEAPRTDTEQRLVEVWNQVLKQTHIGIFDNFFERGGDSILSIQIVARARAVGLELGPRDLFQHQTIAELAQVVQPLAAFDIEQSPVTGKVPLTPIQQAFFARQPKEPWHFNQAILLAVPASINEVALQKTLAIILQHHDALRLRYRQIDDQWQQWHDEISTEEIPYHIEDLSHLSKQPQAQALRERADFWQASLNLETGPLVRLVLFHLGSESRLLWCIHHLAVDGVSWRILLEDLQTAYHQAVASQPIRLPAKTSAFKAWAEHLLTWKDSGSFATQAEYWRKLQKGTPLPIDNPTGCNRIVDSQHYTIRFTADTTQRLLTEAPAAYRTQINDLLLTALMLTLRDWTGDPRHLIDLESHGRADLFEEIDLSRTVGWFTALHTLSLQLPTESDLGTALKAIKEQLRKVPHDGVGYGILRYLCQESLPQGQILFNYLGQFDQSVQDSLFSFAEESSGMSMSIEGEREHLIEINGQTINSCLSLTWSYSGEQYQAQTIQKLADNYQQQLQQLIEHCAISIGYTPSDFPLAKLKQTQLDQLAQSDGNNIADIYPLSPMQQGMLFHSLYAPESGIYFQQIHCALSGKLNIEAFRQAWQHLIDRHTILRTAFWHETDTPLQLVYKTAKLSWQTLDWRELSEAERQQQLQSLLTTERRIGFELNQAPLMRLQVIRETNFKSRLVWHHHHLLLDGWCLPILFTELFEAYAAFVADKIPRLPPIRPYRAYITWLSRQDQEMAKEYWQEQLKEFSAPTRLPMAQYSEGQAHYQELVLTLELQLSQQLKHFSRQHRLTLNTLVQGAWAALLSRYSGESDVVFGVTTSGRQVPITGIDRMLGLFINTLPLRVVVANNDILSTLQTIQQCQQQNDQYAYTALADIQNWSEVPNGIALFDTLVVFENYPVDEKLKDEQHTGSLQITDIQAIEYTNYPITLAVIPGQELHFKLTYDSNRFQTESLERMLAHLSRLLEGLVAQPGQTWHQLPLLTESEQQQLMAWNQTETDYPKNQTIVDLFQAQVEKTPENLAVVFENQELSYRELNTKANQLAHYLMTLGVGAEILVGICIERSLEMVIGLLGILKAGGAYLPLDPAYPAARLAFMLEDAGVGVLLTQSNLVKELPKTTAQVVCFDTETEKLSGLSIDNLASSVKSANLAYVMYTSGSTGQPKGVNVIHRGVVRLVKETNYINLTADEVFLQLAPISFDASTFEIWGSLLNGARLVVMPAQTPTLKELGQAIVSNQITTLWLTASLFRVMVDERLTDLRSVRQLLAGGEVLSVPHVEKVLREIKTCQVINGYGPTENTTFTCCYPMTATSQFGSSIPIGRPIANTQVYILDSHRKPVPIGVPGELYIGGAGLARGYLNRPDLTADKFIANPFSNDPDSRLYKTGDLARYHADGNIEFLGRLDNQVKIRGFRIELGEIETVLSQHPTVQESVVIVPESESSDKRLVAYLVAVSGQIIDNIELRNFIKDRLPDYMIPSAFVQMETMPLTPNGKIDRRALPAPDHQRAEPEETFVAPRDKLELQLTKIWEQVLGIQPIGVRDNFFDLGGHSLLAVRLFAQIETILGMNLPLTILFQAPTIEQLTNILRQKGWSAPWSSLVPIQPNGSKPPLFCVPPAASTALIFVDLARHLGMDQPVYGLQPLGMDGEQAAHNRVEDMAAHYIKEIRTLQPDGPYYLGGMCFGGNIAFEMAQQFQTQGCTVALLALFDPSTPYLAPFIQHRNAFEKIGHYARRTVYHFKSGKLFYNLMDFFVYRRHWWIKMRVKRIIIHQEHRIQYVMRSHNVARMNHVPQVYSGKIIIFQSSQYHVREKKGEGSWAGHWSNLASGEFVRHLIEGSHNEILLGSQSQVLAEKLKLCLDEAQQDVSNVHHP